MRPQAPRLLALVAVVGRPLVLVVGSAFEPGHASLCLREGVPA